MPGMTASGLPAAMTEQRGDNLDLVAPAGGLISGELVAVAGFAGVVNVGGAEGDLCGVSIKGVYAVENSGITPAAGALVAFELTNQNAIAATGGAAAAGTVIETVAAVTDRIKVLLNQAPVIAPV